MGQIQVWEWDRQVWNGTTGLEMGLVIILSISENRHVMQQCMSYISVTSVLGKGEPE